jgi:hypothetical protein
MVERFISQNGMEKARYFACLQAYKELYGTSISFVEQSNGTISLEPIKGINVVRNNKFVKLINKSWLNDIQFNDCTKE